jgi:drug/metabolite transporter (DMT)-like permease
VDPAKKRQLIGSLILTLTAVIWGTAFAFQRSGVDRIEPITFTAARMTLSAVAVGLVVLFQRKDSNTDIAQQKTKKANTIAGGLSCGFFLASASILQQMGIVYTSAGKAGFITALYVLIVPVISMIFFRKRYSFIVWIAVVLGIVGMYLLCMTDSFSLNYGDTLIFFCALLFSGHILCCGYFGSRGDVIKISAIQLVVTACVSWILAFITEKPDFQSIGDAIIPILYCGIMSGGVGYTLQVVGQRFTDPTIASLLMSLESVFAVLAGAILLGERMTVRELLGCIIMFIAIIIVQIPMPKKHGQKKHI